MIRHLMLRSPHHRKGKASFLGMSMKEEKGPNGGNHNFSGKFKFSNVEFSTPCKCIANIVILISVYGSYLYLRLKRPEQTREENKDKL